MHRRAFLGALGVVLGASPRAGAQKVERASRIGYLHPSNPQDIAYVAFRRALSDAGYRIGESTHLEARFAGGDIARLPALAEELVSSRVDVIVAVSPTAIRAARAATQSIPIVMAFSGDDPVKSGFAASLARPGGNTTGLTAVAHDIAPKWVELLADLKPGLKVVGALRSPARADHDVQVASMRVAAQALGIRLHVVEVRGRDEYDGALLEIRQVGGEALVVLSGPEFTANRVHLVELANGRGLPSVFQFADFVQVGGLVSYGPDIAALSARAVDYVDRILKGADPAEMPIEQPRKLHLVINRRTADSLGLTIPRWLLLQADRVIQ